MIRSNSWLSLSEKPGFPTLTENRHRWCWSRIFMVDEVGVNVNAQVTDECHRVNCSPPVKTLVVGSWCWRLASASSHTKRPRSALSVFDCSTSDFIQPNVSSTHLESLIDIDIAKKTARCALYGCPEKFWDSLATPMATFPEIVNGLLL